MAHPRINANVAASAPIRRPPAPYDEFAWMYDRHWGPHSLRKFAPILAEALLARLPAQAQILDVCCGTGQIARWLTERGCRVTGLDHSRAMLRYAKKRAPKATFVLADAQSFALPPRHDAAVSMFDSLNHVLTSAGLAAAFRCIFDALAPSGIFFCDFNVRRKFQDGWRGDFSLLENDHACIVRTRYDDASRRAHWKIAMFRRDRRGIWRRSDLHLVQRAYEGPEVCRALAEAGFVDVEVWDADRTPAGLTPLPPGKSYFLARKPARPPVRKRITTHKDRHPGAGP